MQYFNLKKIKARAVQFDCSRDFGLNQASIDQIILSLLCQVRRCNKTNKLLTCKIEQSTKNTLKST